MVVVAALQRFEMCIVNPDSMQSGETNEEQPYVIISPDELTRHLRTVIVAALTSASCTYPSRVVYRFQGKTGQVALDHLRSVNKTCLVRRLGLLPVATTQAVCKRLGEMFAF